MAVPLYLLKGTLSRLMPSQMMPRCLHHIAQGFGNMFISALSIWGAHVMLREVFFLIYFGIEINMMGYRTIA